MGNREHQCKSCLRVETLKYKTFWFRVNVGTDQCQSCSKKGGNSTSFQKGFTPHNKGQKGYGKWPKWFPKGELNPSWRGGITKESARIRNSKDYLMWRKQVLERDSYSCQICKSTGVDLHVDHIMPFAFNPSLRMDMNNGRTLCVPCHKQTDTYLSGAMKYAV